MDIKDAVVLIRRVNDRNLEGMKGNMFFINWIYLVTDFIFHALFAVIPAILSRQHLDKCGISKSCKNSKNQLIF